jgi:hypothetical protein
MARCEGKNRDGDQCKREVRGDTRFCYVHDPEKDQAAGNEDDVAVEDLELLDLAPILLAGVMAVGVMLLLKGFGKWIPRF